MLQVNFLLRFCLIWVWLSFSIFNKWQLVRNYVRPVERKEKKRCVSEHEKHPCTTIVYFILYAASYSLPLAAHLMEVEEAEMLQLMLFQLTFKILQR